jgi:hypothetical protein
MDKVTTLPHPGADRDCEDCNGIGWRNTAATEYAPVWVACDCTKRPECEIEYHL